MQNLNSFSSDEIVLTKRQVSMLMASMLLFCLLIFMVGFFLGKRTVLEDYSAKVTKEALHDQIDFLLTTQSMQSSQEASLDFSDNLPEITLNPELDANTQVLTEQENTKPVLISTESPLVGSMVAVTESSQPLPVKEGKQYAQLIGFGTKKAAQIFVARLKKQNIPVILKTNISKTASGKQKVWYQAITPTYNSYEELHEQIAKIKRLERIRDKDIKIVHTK
ncbi:MAG: hypothetical protein ACXWL2_02245 [Candidatus Chromulinivorax sp.]